jgi:hypothetical protein
MFVESLIDKSPPFDELLNSNIIDEEWSSSSSSTIMMQQDEMCRICHEYGGTCSNPLIIPCYCTGTIKYVHRQCLNTWRHSHPSNHIQFTHCSICHTPYQILERNTSRKWSNSFKLYLFYLFIVSVMFIVLIVCGFLGKSTCMGLVKLQMKKFQDLIQDTDRRRITLIEPNIFKTMTTVDQEMCPIRFKAKSVTDIFFNCNLKREKTNKPIKSPLTYPISQVMLNVESLDRYSDCYEIWKTNVTNLKLWMHLWEQHYYSLNAIHFIMGAITLSFFGIFHLVVFWRAYFDFYLSNIATDKYGVNNHQMIFVSFLNVETYLFSIFVIIGLIKSAIIIHKLCSALRNKWQLNTSGIDDDEVMSIDTFSGEASSAA